MTQTAFDMTSPLRSRWDQEGAEFVQSNNEWCARACARLLALNPQLKAAEALQLSAITLAKLSVVDEVIAEPLGGAHQDPVQSAASLKAALSKHLSDLRGVSTEKLLENRYERYRHLGSYEEAGVVHS